MDAFISQIATEAGVSEDVAKEIVDLVIGKVKSRLPVGMQGVVDSALAGESAGGLGGIASGVIGSFFGRK